jgi:hypothetical protein
MPGRIIRTVSPWRSTGHTRARPTWFGLVVLDIREERTHSFVPRPADYDGEHDTFETRWRRARFRDISQGYDAIRGIN